MNRLRHQFRQANYSHRYFGSLIAAWTTYGTLRLLSDWSWRLPSLLQVLPSFLQLVLIWFLPESPRYLISKERDDEALEIMAKYHANGDRQSEWLRFEFAEIRSSIAMEKQSAATSWKALVATREKISNRSRTTLPSLPANFLCQRVIVRGSSFASPAACFPSSVAMA